MTYREIGGVLPSHTQLPQPTSPGHPSHIDIHGQSVSADMLVALLDRPHEMKELAKHNHDYFEALYHYIEETQGTEARKTFQTTVFATREDLPDRVWLTRIGTFLEHSPVFWSKFKESVGYDDVDDETDAMLLQDMLHRPSSRRMPYSPPSSLSDPGIMTTVQEDTDGEKEDEPPHQLDSTMWMDLLALRDHPNAQADIVRHHDAFLRRARQRLVRDAPTSSRQRSAAARRRSSIDLDDHGIGVDPEVDDDEEAECVRQTSFEYDPYQRFIRLLTTTRTIQPNDELWLESLAEVLEGRSDLVEELHAIVSDL